MNNLRELLNSMRANEIKTDWDKLPTFGGSEPSNTQECWSWDETHLIVGTCSADVEIIRRSDW